jgi:adenine-specific DNA-methyltransferase
VGSDARHTNALVVGDNLAAMRALPEGCVDLVVTDPPYNTGHGFAYDDSFRGADGRRAGRHEAWLEMMRPRVEQVRRVLSPRGALAISIDDHEVARLRLLLDEVLGEEACLAQVVVGLNPKGRQLGPGFATSHEYLLLYARDPRRCVLDASIPDTVDPGDFPLTDAQGRRHRLLPLRNTNTRFNPVTAPTMHYPLWGDPASGRVGTEPFDGAVEIRPVFGDGRPAVWRWSRPLVEERAGDLVCRRVRGPQGERVDVSQRDWLERSHRGPRRKKLRTVWLSDEIGSTDTAVAEVKALVGPVFESPKPTGLVRRVLATMPDDVAVLDPFAGSGTTGHAVALANAADGGTRRCLSIELAAPVRPGSHADRAGVETIADITRARLGAVGERVGGGLVELDDAAAWLSPGPRSASAPGRRAPRR